MQSWSRHRERVRWRGPGVRGFRADPVIAAGHDRREMTTPPNFSAYLNYRNVTKWIDQLALRETVVPVRVASRSPKKPV